MSCDHDHEPLIKAIPKPKPGAIKTRPDFIDPILERIARDVVKRYQKLRKRVLRRLRIVGRGRFTYQTLSTLAAYIRLAHQAFAIENLGGAAALGISPRVVDLLRAGGHLTGAEADFVKAAWVVGRAGAAGQRIASIDLISIMDRKLDGPWPLGPVELRALDWARSRSAAWITGLGNRVGDAFEVQAIDTEHAVKRQLEARIRREVAAAVAHHETAKQLATNLGRATGDWARNMTRIAITETQNAHQQGWAAHYRATTGPATRVSKLLDPQACEDCRRLYLEPDGRPRIFDLVDLEANGTNVGLKRADWKAVVGATHPHCHCSLVRVPEGFGWDEDARMVRLES